MALHYVLGPSGSGKSYMVYEKIIAEAMEHMDKRYIVLVPEQYTMSTQRLLVNMHPDHCIMNIDVLSFNRLAYRVFEELGQNMTEVLDDTGKALVLRRLAFVHGNELKALKTNITKVGYVNQVKSLISEMTQYNITPEVLREMIEYDVMSENFRRKASDLLVLYEAFLDFIKDKYVTTESILQKLDDILDDSNIVADSVVIMDEFTGFTPVQYQLVEHMLKICQDVYVTMNMDPDDSVYEKRGEDELFSMSKEFVEHLNRTAHRAGCQIVEPTILDGSKGRLSDSLVLGLLEKHIFRDKAYQYNGKEDASKAISLYSLGNRREELRTCAIEISRLIRTGGYRYSDFAVVCPELENYRFIVSEIWRDFDIPFFIDSKSEIVFHPFTEAIEALFEMYDRGFSRDSVFRFLRCGFTDLEVEEIDKLDNYAIASGLSGKKRYFSPFTVACNQFSQPEQLVELNEIRMKFIKPFIAFDEAVGLGKHTVTEIATALYSFITSFDCERKLKALEAVKEEQNDAVKAREYGKIYRIVMDILDRMVGILDDIQMDLNEFYDIYEAGLSNSTIGLIPPDKDSVTIGDMERTRLDNVRVLFIIGAADDAIPKKQENGGILSQLEREQLLKRFEMAPSDRVKSFRQRYYIYMMLTAPSEKLFITYPRASGDGKGLGKSYLMDDIEKMFPTLKVTAIEDRPMEDMLFSKNDSRRLMVRLMSKVRDQSMDTLSEEEQHMLTKLLKVWGEDSNRFNELLSAVFFSHETEKFSTEIMTAINECFNEDETVSGSVSKFECFAECGYKYFVKYVLRATSQEKYELSNIDIGNFYHDTMYRYGELLKENNISWHDITPQQQESLTQEAIDYATEHMPKIASIYDPIQKHMIEGMRSTLEYCIQTITDQVRAGQFEPMWFEENVENELINPLTDELNAIVYGKIDRVDINQTDHEINVRIVDYKSSGREIDVDKCFYGLSMQLPMYMGVVVDKLKAQHPELRINPSSMLYYHVDDPMVEGVTLEEIKDNRRKLRIMTGLTTDDESSIMANDSTLEPGDSSQVIKVSRKKGGELGSNSQVISASDMRILIDYVNANGAMLSEKILAGEFEPAPARYNKGETCKYCEYKSVCRFNTTVSGFAPHECDQIGQQEAIGMMAEQLKEWGKEAADEVD